MKFKLFLVSAMPDRLTSCLPFWILCVHFNSGYSRSSIITPVKGKHNHVFVIYWVTVTTRLFIFFWLTIWLSRLSRPLTLCKCPLVQPWVRVFSWQRRFLVVRVDRGKKKTFSSTACLISPLLECCQSAGSLFHADLTLLSAVESPAAGDGKLQPRSPLSVSLSCVWIELLYWIRVSLRW